MYELTLSANERDAIDWVGGRYANGNDLYDALMECEITPDADWDVDYDLMFHVPEHVAWTIREIAEEDNYTWPCFCDDLAAKLTRFCDGVV